MIVKMVLSNPKDAHIPGVKKMLTKPKINNTEYCATFSNSLPTASGFNDFESAASSGSCWTAFKFGVNTLPFIEEFILINNH
jgi:hypothetical protein